MLEIEAKEKKKKKKPLKVVILFVEGHFRNNIT